MPSEIQIPFALDANGQIAVETNPDRQIRQHVLSLINTAPSERVVLGDYGTPLSREIFENDPSLVTAEVHDMVQFAFSKWEPGIALLDIATSTSGLNGEQVNFSANYERLDAPTSGLGTSANINTAVIGTGGRVSEVVRA